MKKESVEERIIRSMGQAVEIAEGTAAPSRDYYLPLIAKRVSGPAVPECDAGSNGRGHYPVQSTDRRTGNGRRRGKQALRGRGQA